MARLTAVMSLVMIPSFAMAEAGAGGGTGGGAGGITQPQAPGGDGGDGQTDVSGGAGGGGGGAGTTGGDGGTGGDGAAPGSGGLGGSGGAAPGSVGAVGVVGSTDGGGGGGGGGAHGYVGPTLPGVGATGGAGGAGGAGPGAGSGGGGGAGGYGATITSDGALGTLAVGVTGGAGGVGGASTGGTGGDGGDGGTGLLFTGAGTTTFTIGAGITGGVGGAAGAGVSNGTAGAGGAGVVGQNLLITMGGAGAVIGGVGANAITFTGGINSLTFSNASTGLTGNIGLTGLLTFDQIAPDVAVTNIITGSGSVAKTGAGAITLSGVNTYAGFTRVTAGTLRATVTGALGAAGGALIVNGGLLDLDAAQSKGSLSGLGGTINLDAALDVTQTVNQTYAGAFTGTADLTKAGAATLTLTGDSSTYTGDTNVTAGTLLVSNGAGTFGTAATLVSVGSGATLGGVGTLGGGFTAASGARIAPGALGVLTVAGNGTFEAGSTFAVTVNDANQSSLLNAGNILINGGTIDVTTVAGNYSAANFYTIINATSVTGQFAAVVDTLPDIDFIDLYDGTTVRLGLVQSSSTLSPKENGPASIFGAINASLIFAETLARRIGANGDAAPSAAGVGQLVVRDNPAPLSTWLLGFGESTSIGSSGAAAGYDSEAGGLAGGVEYTNYGLGTTRLGIGGGYTRSNIDVTSGGAEVDGGHVGIYASHTQGSFALTGAVAYSASDYDLSRQIAVGTGMISATGEADGEAFSAYGDAFYNVAPMLGVSPVRFGPVARLRGVHATRDLYTEAGAGLLNLTVSEDSVDQWFGALGVRASTQVNLAGFTVTPLVELLYEQDFSDQPTVGTSTISLAGASFTTPINNGGRDRVAVGASMGVALSDALFGHVRYDGAVGNDFASHKGSLGLKYVF